MESLEVDSLIAPVNVFRLEIRNVGFHNLVVFGPAATSECCRTLPLPPRPTIV
jgi:hypothetical protein